MQIAKRFLNKKRIILLSALFLIGIISIIFLVEKQLGARTLHSIDTSLNKVNYEARNVINMDEKQLLKSQSLVTNSLPDGVIFHTSKATINDHKYIAENSKYELYLKEESLSILIRDKESGAIMESIVNSEDEKSNATWKAFMKSGIVVQVLKGINIVPTTADINTAKKEVSITDTGFTAKVIYDKFGIGFTLNVSLDEEGLIVEIPNDSIIEDSSEFKIGEIYVYPFLGNTHLGDRNGYMFVPDGNGALIYLEDNEGRFSSNFSQYVYGMNIGLEESYTLSLLWDTLQTVNEADKIMAPVFGMVHTDSNLAYLGIIESGNYSAKIEAYPNGAYTNYNWICSKFILRQIYTQPTGNRDGSIVKVQDNRNEFDIRVRYNFVNNNDANYTGLAKEYRNYLLENKLVKEVGDDFNIRLDFLGIDKENWMIFKKNVVMTTIDEIKTMYGELREAGIRDIFSIYKGWQHNGLNAVPITKYKADKDIGGTKELTSFSKELKDMGIDFYLYQDGLRVNPDLSNANFNMMKQITKRVYEERSYKYVFDTFRYLTPTRSKDNLLKSAKSYEKAGIDNLAISGISNILFTYTHKGKVYSRVDTANTYENAIASLDETMNLALEKPLSYLWKYTDAIIDMPVASSNFIFTDEEVPFLSIALKGIIPMYAEYVNFEANQQEFFLQLVEMGMNPSFYLTYEDPSYLQYTNSSDVYSSKYSVYKDTITEYYHQLKEVYEKTKGAYIIGHNQYSNGVTIVEYDNGIKVYINYNEAATVLVDGYEMEPMTYKVGER